MKYEILYQDAFPLVKCNLQKGERIKAESNAMIAMSNTMEVTAGVEGGIMRGLGRMLSGEKFFFQYLSATRGDGEILFAHSKPGSIIDVELDGSYGLTVQKDGFLAATDGIEIDTKMQNLTKGIFSGEGFFVLNVHGKGLVFLSSFGAVHPITLAAGEEIVIDNSHLAAWTSTMSYKIEKAAAGWAASIFSGECLVCRFQGPGTVLIQTRNPAAFAGWLRGLGLGAK